VPAELLERAELDVERAARAWQALDDATGERDGKQRLQALIEELDGAGYTAAAKCLADDPGALVVHLRYPTRHRRRGAARTCSNARSPSSNAAPR